MPAPVQATWARKSPRLMTATLLHDDRRLDEGMQRAEVRVSPGFVKRVTPGLPGVDTLRIKGPVARGNGAGASSSWLVKVTVCPAAMVSFAGWKASLLIWHVVGADAWAGAARSIARMNSPICFIP